MIRIRIIGLALVAVFAMGAIGASTASAHRTWWYENAAKEKLQVGPMGSGKKLTAKIKAGQEADLFSEIKGKKVEVICEKITIANGEIYNEAPTGGKVGRDKGKIKFEKCRLEGIAKLVCKLKEPSIKEIISPPNAEGRSTLVENTEKTEKGKSEEEGKIWNDFLPQPVGEGEANESLFAIIHTEGALCPVTEDKVKSTLPVGAFLAANEGEGGVAAEIKPQGYSVVKTFLFPCKAKTNAFNWLENEIKIGAFADFTPTQEGPASFCAKGSVSLEVEAELTTKEAFDVQ